MPKKYKVLNDGQIDHFLEHGYVVLTSCFSRELADTWKTLAFRRLGYDPNDPATWEQVSHESPHHVNASRFNLT